MTRAFAYLAVAGAAIAVGVLALVKMGAPGWFTITFAAVLVGVTVIAIWPALVAGLVFLIGWKVMMWRKRRAGMPK